MVNVTIMDAFVVLVNDPEMSPEPLAAIPVTLILEPKAFYDVHPHAVPYFAISGLLYIFRTLTWSMSLRYCSVSITQPFDFSRIIFVILISYFMLHEDPDIRSCVAAIIIFISYIYMINKKDKKKI